MLVLSPKPKSLIKMCQILTVRFGESSIRRDSGEAILKCDNNDISNDL